MIEREFIREKLKQLKIKETIQAKSGKNAEIGSITMEKTPLGERVVISTTRPGMIIGRAGSTIKALTSDLKNRFKLDNPQIETSEISSPYFSANIVANKIASELERFGPNRFKGIGYRELKRILDNGAMGAEIIIDGPIPGSRSRKWRFYDGYMKKCGFISDNLLDKAHADSVLKKGTVGITVTIMHEGTPLPDKISIVEPEDLQSPELEEIEEEKPEETKPKPKVEKKTTETKPKKKVETKK
tara:strand:- start:1913 stop:2641 length:729 start_codon:yes stop_codon:yes gene_type:complete